MFDIFYLNCPTHLFPQERKADSIEHAREMSRTRYLWVVDGHNDYSQFDFTWEPVPWESNQIHVWPSQHQENGGTYLVPKVPTTDTNRNHSVVRKIGSAPRIGVDHGNGLSIMCKEKTRYISDYLGTLRRILSKSQHEYVWIVSSVCDYTTFDFTWHPSEWQQDMLHVFASNEQKFGDTFYIHVPTFMQKTAELALLEWFDTIHFVSDISVPRRPVPVVRHEHDSQVPAVWAHNFQDPVVQFVRHNAVDNPPAINLWREKMKTVVPLTPGAGSVLVPREAKNYLKTQLYDYSNIDKTHRMMGNDQLLDIVFIDNGEPNAEENYMHLKWAAERANSIKIHRSSGVNGRAAAYHAAAQASTTDWFFAVFAKLRVSTDFDWSWQPDRMQQAKHYIFHAKNPINGLEYGHQAMIAYNKRLVLANPGRGLDFTLDDEHEVVPLLSGTAEYAHSKWSTWRTAFRECLKLKGQADVESEYRLNRWLGPVPEAVINSEWSRWGAEDAVAYYEEVGGNFDALKKSYEWSWLASYALLKRNLTPDQ
jgi:hypothetical protein